MIVRASTRSRRTLPAMSLVFAVTAVAAGLLAACGGLGGGSPSPAATETVAASPSSTSTASPAATQAPVSTVFVYFLRGEKLGVAERDVPRTKAVATAALTALCEGPSASETAAGLSSALPAGTKVLSVAIHGNVATVDLSGAFASGGGSLSLQARVAQVVYTATRFPGVSSVDFRVDGVPVTSLGGEGLVLDAPQQRADWSQFEPPIFVESPGVGGTISSPFVLSGTASVFEGSFMARLVDDSGRRVVSVPVQASRGGPERGDFRKTIAYSSSAGQGVLIVYDQSMEDGSRQNEVRVPVTFAP